jgi:hypothetical protein
MEVAHLGQPRAMLSAMLSFIALNIVPNYLFRPATDIRMAESVSGIAFLAVGFNNWIMAGLAVLYLCSVSCFSFFDYSADNDDDDEPEYLWRFGCGCCVCLCAIPFLALEIIALAKNGMPFGLTVEFALAWPELQFSKTVSAVRALLFLVTCTDILTFVMTPIKKMAAKEIQEG